MLLILIPLASSQLAWILVLSFCTFASSLGLWVLYINKVIHDLQNYALWYTQFHLKNTLFYQREYRGNGFYQGLFQSVTSFPHHWFTSLTCSSPWIRAALQVTWAAPKVEPANGWLCDLRKSLKKCHRRYKFLRILPSSGTCKNSLSKSGNFQLFCIKI